MDIKNKIQKYNKSQLNEAVQIQNKLQMLITPFVCYENKPAEFDSYLKRMSRKISNTKAFAVFKENITYPLPTVDFCKTVTNSMYKIFQGDGKSISFMPDEINKEGIPTLNYISDDVWNRFIYAPNSLLFSNKEGDEIKRYFIDISSVEILNIDNENEVSEIYYTKSDGNKLYIDKESISEYDKDDELIKTSNHGLSDCPVVFISKKLYSHTKPLVRVNFFIDCLGDIEELLTIGIQSNVINRHILPYVVKADSSGCEYRSGNTSCSNGYLYISIENSEPARSLDEDGNHSKCPVCNKEIGFGSLLEVNTNQLDSDDMAKVIQNILNYKTLDVEHLEYPSKKKEYEESKLFNKIVNKQESLNNAQQHNEARVLSTHEDKLNVIIYWKTSFEYVWGKLITQTLQYKSKTYKSTDCSLGTKFYLNSETEYQDLITKSIENQTTDFVDNYRGLIEKQYQDNDDAKERSLFILELERAGKPLFDSTAKDIIDLYKSDKITTLDFNLNRNYYQYIRKFEIDNNIDVHKFDIEKSLDERIKIINTKIKEYGLQQES